jgi:hypothetical protein
VRPVSKKRARKAAERRKVVAEVICRSHHSWIDDHPKTAALIGLHGYSWDRPA